ncbi:MAG: MBL fold metallo-hydrolase, partial [Tindallia sp. MSAO_Bac2]
MKYFRLSKSFSLLLVIALLFSLMLIVPNSVKAQEINVERIFGADRFETAVEISKEGWTSSDTVILARSDDFPDALAGTPLAYQEDAPILLTPTESLSSTTITEIERLDADKAIILGGTAAVSDTVEIELLAMGLEVERIGGDNRYETASLIAEYLPEADQAIIAYGGNFPDALAIGPYAAQNGYPILLTRTDSIPSATEEILTEINNTIIVGGTAVIGNTVFEQAPNSTRIAGDDRFDTASKIVSKLDLPLNKAYVATGMNFADALTGSALAAKDNASMLLVRHNAVPSCTKDLIEEKGIINFIILGGTGAVSDTVELQLKGEEEIVDPGEMVMHFIDVGQGDSVLIETVCESYVLIDGGPSGAGDDLVAYLNGLGIDRLDKVIATHEHADHVGGLVSVYESPIEVETTYGSEYEHDTITAENFRSLAEEHSVYKTATAFDTLNLDCEYTEMSFIHPYEGASGDIHYMNLALNVEFNEFSALITG